jgi:glycosyltransferase involved in cell wall biosynthesis
LQIDVSLVLNLHREGKYLARTLSSLLEAVAYARVHGVVVEFVIVLDQPDSVTKNALGAFDLSSVNHIQSVEVDFGSLGLSRNVGIEKARGKYVRLTDGDDLVSFNLISAMYFLAEQLGSRAILIPEWLFIFGERYHRNRYGDLKKINPLSMIDSHPFVSQIFFERSLFERIRFEDLRLSPGYAYEDWHFATEAIALGYEYYVARDTILFYRERLGGLLSMADSISVRQISPSTLFIPGVFQTRCKAGYQELSTKRAEKDIKDDRIFIDGAVCRHLLHAANLIEPAMTLDAFRNSSFFHLQETNFAIGKLYYEICDQAKDELYRDIFIVPFFGTGGAERYFANIINGLLEIEGDSRMLVILGERHPRNDWLGQLPPRVTAIDLSRWLDAVGERGVDIITLKLIQSVGRGARLHVRASAFGQRFLAAYGRALGSNKRIYYCFSQAARNDGEMRFIEPWRFRFVADNIESIDLVITDNQALAQFDRRRIGITPEKWRVLPSLHEPAIDRAKALARERRSSKRVLWASRIAREKRPDLIIAVAKRVAARQLDLIIEVRGERASGFDPLPFKKYAHIDYLGAYDRFSDCGNDYVAFMYTSSQDGVPNILLEAASAGIPIVAPDIGGISEFVEDGVTGLLLPDLFDEDRMADAYVDAIVLLQNDPDLGTRLASAAYDRVATRCGRRAYRANLESWKNCPTIR